LKQEIPKLLLLCFCLQAKIYVDGTQAPKIDTGNTQMVLFTQSSKTTDESGIQNKGINKDEADDEEDESEEILLPGDLVAFAWQISQGMVRHFEHYRTLL